MLGSFFSLIFAFLENKLQIRGLTLVSGLKMGIVLFLLDLFWERVNMCPTLPKCQHCAVHFAYLLKYIY